MSPSLPDDSRFAALNDDSWWAMGVNLLDDDNFGSPLAFDASEGGLFNGNFVPPPPRPAFLDESAQADGVTTCGMCSWATKTDYLMTANGGGATGARQTRDKERRKKTHNQSIVPMHLLTDCSSPIFSCFRYFLILFLLLRPTNRLVG